MEGVDDLEAFFLFRGSRGYMPKKTCQFNNYDYTCSAIWYL